MPTYKVEIVDDAGQTFHVYASADSEAEAELLAVERAERSWTLLHGREVASACVIGELKCLNQ